MSTGDARANDFLDAIYGSGHAANIPSTLYVALYYVRPDDDGGGTEASYDTYARVEVDNDDTTFEPAADRRKEVSIDVEFPTPGEDTDEFVAWAIHGHATNDDILTWGRFHDRLTGEEDQPIKIPAGTLAVELV